MCIGYPPKPDPREPKLDPPIIGSVIHNEYQINKNPWFIQKRQPITITSKDNISHSTDTLHGFDGDVQKYSPEMTGKP